MVWLCLCACDWKVADSNPGVGRTVPFPLGPWAMPSIPKMLKKNKPLCSYKNIFINQNFQQTLHLCCVDGTSDVTMLVKNAVLPNEMMKSVQPTWYIPSGFSCIIDVMSVFRAQGQLEGEKKIFVYKPLAITLVVLSICFQWHCIFKFVIL